MKGFAELPDPLDLESFKRLTDHEARIRFRNDFLAADDKTKAATLKALAAGVKQSTPETEAIIDRSEAFAIKNGWDSWNQLPEKFDFSCVPWTWHPPEEIK